MAQRGQTDFLAGVIEGFYGPPWTAGERRQLFEWMAAWGLNTYLYCPKDDLKHRAIWREPYSTQEADLLKESIDGCRGRQLRFIYGIGPGLDIRYGDEADLGHLIRRFEQLLALGGEHFALLFDDIPDRVDPVVLKRWGSLASAQCHIANTLMTWLRERRSDAQFLFCPTPYCGRMAERHLGGENYLAILGRELLPEIQVFWTGPEIISREITIPHVQAVAELLRRKPLIWDNLHANDYDGRRFFCGPYAGRPSELRSQVSGILLNPNCEFPLNYIPFRTFGDFQRCEGPWEPRQAYLRAAKEWLPSFAAVRRDPTLEDLTLFGDAFYLPYEDGSEAEALARAAEALFSTSPGQWGEGADAFLKKAARLREFCAQASEVRDRGLFYALSRRLWELREELDLLERYVQFRRVPGQSEAQFGSDFHLPKTYRGGFVPRLQRLLVQEPDGTLKPSSAGALARSAQSAPPSAETGTSRDFLIRASRPGDEAGAYYVCLKTGDYGQDGEPFYREDPDALGRVFVGPYLAYEPGLSLILEDAEGICGYALGALDSHAFYARYESEWRPKICARFPEPQGDPGQWSRVQQVHFGYHHPDYFCPEPYPLYPSHLHIDLLPRARGHGFGRRMMEQVMSRLRELGSPGAHLGVSTFNVPALGFYQRLGFQELIRAGSGNDRCIYLGKSLAVELRP